MSRSHNAVLASASLLDEETPEMDVLQLNLADIPQLPFTLEVEGLRPILLSRLLDLLTPQGDRL